VGFIKEAVSPGRQAYGLKGERNEALQNYYAAAADLFLLMIRILMSQPRSAATE